MRGSFGRCSPPHYAQAPTGRADCRPSWAQLGRNSVCVGLPDRPSPRFEGAAAPVLGTRDVVGDGSGTADRLLGAGCVEFLGFIPRLPEDPAPVDAVSVTIGGD